MSVKVPSHEMSLSAAAALGDGAAEVPAKRAAGELAQPALALEHPASLRRAPTLFESGRSSG